MDLDSAVLYTNDIKRIADFYKNIVGLKLEYMDGQQYVSFIFPNCARLGINKSNFKREKPGSQTVFIATKRIEKLYKKFKKLGYKFFGDFEEYD